MRRLAEQLDVWPMSLCRYFHDKEELVLALADAAAAAEDIASPAPSGPWRERMRELLDLVCHCTPVRACGPPGTRLPGADVRRSGAGRLTPPATPHLVLQPARQ